MICTKPYPLIDPNLLLATLPGPPSRALPGVEPTSDHEALGYVRAGDLFLAAVVTRLRSTPSRDEYDSDLSVAVKVAPTERRATTLFRAECRQDETFLVRASASPIALNPALEAAEAFAWTSPGPVPHRRSGSLRQLHHPLRREYLRRWSVYQPVALPGRCPGDGSSCLAGAQWRDLRHPTAGPAIGRRGSKPDGEGHRPAAAHPGLHDTEL